MRHIKEIKDLPISQLSDEEILKATLYRLEAKAAVLVYLDRDNHSWFFYRYKKRKGIFGGDRWCTLLINAWKDYFKEPKRVTNKNK